jgi:hypothetical protein
MTTTRNDLTPPGTIIAAFFGFLLSTVGAAATAVVVLTSRQEILDVLRRSNQESSSPMTEDQLQQSVTLAQGIAVGVALLIGLVYLWLSFKLKAGRNWARVVLTIFTLLQVGSLYATEGNSVAGYASAGVAVLALVLSYLPASNVYMAATKRAR